MRILCVHICAYMHFSFDLRLQTEQSTYVASAETRGCTVEFLVGCIIFSCPMCCSSCLWFVLVHFLLFISFVRTSSVGAVWHFQGKSVP
jgi:hypothetical protein